VNTSKRWPARKRINNPPQLYINDDITGNTLTFYSDLCASKLVAGRKENDFPFVNAILEERHITDKKMFTKMCKIIYA
jgi:hypothetical protein